MSDVVPDNGTVTIANESGDYITVEYNNGASSRQIGNDQQGSFAAEPGDDFVVISPENCHRVVHAVEGS